MNYRLYCIYDRVAGEAGPLFQAVNDQVAVRQSINVLHTIPLSLRPDYQLLCVGQFDSRTCNIDLLPDTLPGMSHIEVDMSVAFAKHDEFKEVSTYEQ